MVNWLFGLFVLCLVWYMGGLGWSMFGLFLIVGLLYVVWCKCLVWYMVDFFWELVLCSVFYYFVFDKQFVLFVVEVDVVLN